MPKKGQTNNPHGRPKIDPADSIIQPVRQLGRIDDETWQLLKDAAKREGLTFTAWSVPILVRAAKRAK